MLLRLLIILSCLLFGASQHSLTCRNHLEAVEGATMEVLCQSKNPIDSCTLDFPGYKKIKAYAGVKNQNYEFVGNYEKGECGIRFPAMKRELEGHVTVEVTFPDEDAHAKAEINVTMLYPPDDIHVVSNGKKFEFKEGDVMTFNCSCSTSNPLPTISLRIGEDEPGVASNQTSVNASKTAEISDFDKKVVCVVHHSLFRDQPFTFSRPLTILHKPKNISEIIPQVDTNKCIKVTVSAFPKPYTYRWRKNNGNYLADKNSWLIPVKGTHCLWEVGVNVSEITADDLKHDFELTIANSEGLYTTKVILEAKKDPILIYMFWIFSIILFGLLIVHRKKIRFVSAPNACNLLVVEPLKRIDTGV